MLKQNIPASGVGVGVGSCYSSQHRKSSSRPDNLELSPLLSVTGCTEVSSWYLFKAVLEHV